MSGSFQVNNQQSNQAKQHNEQENNSSQQHNDKNMQNGHQNLQNCTNEHQNEHEYGQAANQNEHQNEQQSSQNIRISYGSNRNEHSSTPNNENQEQDTCGSTEVNTALNGLTARQRHTARRSASMIETRRDVPKLSQYKTLTHKSRSINAISSDSTDAEDEVSRQVKQVTDPQHFKAGPHFQHLYLKRAEAIVQKQLLQKSQSLHVKVPNPSEMEVNEYATDIPNSSNVPVLRMTIAKVKTSQPVKTYVQIGNTVKEAAFSVGNKPNDADQTMNTTKRTTNHMIVLPTHSCCTGKSNLALDKSNTVEDRSNTPTHKSNKEVHFVDSIVSKPKTLFSKYKTFHLKENNSLFNRHGILRIKE